MEALRLLIGLPEHACKAWVWEQYDAQVGADTAVSPGRGAGVVRVHGTDKALAFTSDVTPRYVVADPVEGGRQAVAEAYRNLCAVGARPLAATDNLNFGNPERPRVMGQIVGAIRGIGEACASAGRADRLGQRLALQRDRGPRDPADADHRRGGAAGEPRRPHRRQPRGRAMWRCCWGETRGHLGRSALLAALGREEGPPPPVDLVAERAHGEFVRANAARIRACADLSDGGLALAAFEMAAGAGIGLALEAEGVPTLFGEDQARYLIACDPAEAGALLAAAEAAGLPLARAGTFGGPDLTLGAERAPMADLLALWRGAFEAALG